MKIIFLHVGKCAGGTVLAQFHKKGILYEELHCGDAPAELKRCLDEDDGTNHYVISVRDPLSRFLSAFNFDKYEKILKGKGVNNLLWNQIYNTFDSANHLCESYVGEDEELRQLAHKAFFRSHLHIHLTLSWYLPHTCLVKLPTNRATVVRTEFVETDLNTLFSRLGLGRVETLGKDKDAKQFLADLGIDDPLYLSHVSRIVLEGVFDADYRLLDYFYESGLMDNRYASPAF
ncbi:hypothetical protein [Marinimicrobium sp. C2-29]|uniref:hypothetical protein n=1 Tax=Marinimicrobium sp. C2-29 TaxID=3139825 RepID=UPI00313929CA